MRLKRKIDEYLREWKKSKNKMPLIVKGARQIGKTESIKNFGLNNYKSLIEINFVLQPEYKDIFDKAKMEYLFAAKSDILGEYNKKADLRRDCYGKNQSSAVRLRKNGEIHYPLSL